MKGGAVNDILEILGALLIVAFFAILWWPSALAVAGVMLLVAAFAGDHGDPDEAGDS